MLKKLIKHEWKDVSRVLLPVNLVLLLLTMIGCVILSACNFDSESSLALVTPLLLLYTISLMTLFSITLIYVYVRYYKNLFTAEGYLMHTLPVTPIQLFHSKLIVGFFWVFLNNLFSILSAAALGFAAGFHSAGSYGTDPETSFSDEFLSIFTDGNSIESFSFSESFGYSPAAFFILILAIVIFMCLSTVLMGYLSVLLGQLVEKARLAAAIGFYFAIYLVMQIVTSLSMIGPNLSFIDSLEETSANFMGKLFHTLLPSTMITHLILSIVLYAACYSLTRRGANLE